MQLWHSSEGRKIMAKDSKVTGFWRIRPILIVLSLVFISGTYPAWAGPNSSAGCALDLDYATHNYDSGITAENIESVITAEAGDEIWVAVVAQDVSNLDTYQAEVEFDPDHIAFVEGYEDEAFGGVENLLKKNGGTTIGFQAVENTPGKVNIANTLTKSDTAEAPEGSGIIALLKFKVLGEDIRLTLSNVRYMDSEGSNEPIVVDSVSNLTDAVVNLVPLTVKIDSPSPDAVIKEGGSFDFRGTVTGGNEPLAYSWNFGGGADNSEEANPGEVTFQTAGNYTVTFTVTDADGDMHSASMTVSVYVDTEPTAKIIFPASNTIIYEEQFVDFQGIITGYTHPFNYSWDFGGGLAVCVNKDHGKVTFQTVGDYTITFTVSDNNGDTSRDSVTVTVKEIIPGDIDGDGTPGLKDAILALQVLAGMSPSDVHAVADVNGDEKIGMEEVIYVLRVAANMKDS